MSDQDDGIEGVGGTKKKSANYFEQYAAKLHEQAEQKMRDAALQAKLTQQGEQHQVAHTTQHGMDQGSGDVGHDSLVIQQAASGSKGTSQGTTTKETVRQDASFPPNAVPFPAVTPKQVTDPGEAGSQHGGEGSSDSAATQGVTANAVLDAREAVKQFRDTAKRVMEQVEKALKDDDPDKAVDLLEHAGHILEQGANAAEKPPNLDPATAAGLYEEAANTMRRAAKLLTQ